MMNSILGLIWGLVSTMYDRGDFAHTNIWFSKVILSTSSIQIYVVCDLLWA